MGSDADKTRIELAELNRFLDRVQLPINRESIQKLLGENQPDFKCRDTSGNELAFELTSICAGDVARLVVTAPSQPSGAIWTSDPTERIVRQKMTKTYQIALPVELLCYWDGRTVSTDDMVLPTILKVACATPNPFRRVWYNGEEGSSLVWSTG